MRITGAATININRAARNSRPVFQKPYQVGWYSDESAWMRLTLAEILPSGWPDKAREFLIIFGPFRKLCQALSHAGDTLSRKIAKAVPTGFLARINSPEVANPPDITWQPTRQSCSENPVSQYANLTVLSAALTIVYKANRRLLPYS